MKNRIFVDITELINFAKYSNSVTGIQRVIVNLCKELEKEKDANFVFYDSKGERWLLINGFSFGNGNELESTKVIGESWKVAKLKWSETRERLKRNTSPCARLHYLSSYIKSHTIRIFLGKTEVSLGNGMTVTPLDPLLDQGGVLLIPGIPNVLLYQKTIAKLAEKLKIAYFFHDVIPVTAPEFVILEEWRNFKNYLEMMHHTASLLITSASNNVQEYVSYIGEHYKGEIDYKIVSIGLPVDFNIQYSLEDYGEISSVSRRLSHYKYCLSVGSVGPRKNHFELLQAWKKFYESDAYNNEVLVVAGNPWATASDIVKLLQSHCWGGSVVYIESPCDKELSYLYDHCKFTVCVSLYEGWGLPVSESIAAGKPVVIYDETTLPEAGYGAANVVKSRDLKALRGEIERLFGDEAYYAESFKKVQEVKAKLPTWKDFAYKLLSQIDEIQ